MTGKAVDISSDGSYPGDVLSNFTPYTFTFRGRDFCTMESLLQGMKFEGIKKQDRVFGLIGKAAKRKGKKSKWYLRQTLYWQGEPMKRDSSEYWELVIEAFRSLSLNKDFRKALLATGDRTLYHTMGKADPTRTILTEKEFCDILTSIREEIQTVEEKTRSCNLTVIAYGTRIQQYVYSGS